MAVVSSLPSFLAPVGLESASLPQKPGLSQQSAEVAGLIGGKPAKAGTPSDGSAIVDDSLFQSAVASQMALISVAKPTASAPAPAEGVRLVSSATSVEPVKWSSAASSVGNSLQGASTFGTVGRLASIAQALQKNVSGRTDLMAPATAYSALVSKTPSMAGLSATAVSPPMAPSLARNAASQVSSYILSEFVTQPSQRLSGANSNAKTPVLELAQSEQPDADQLALSLSRTSSLASQEDIRPAVTEQDTLSAGASETPSQEKPAGTAVQSLAGAAVQSPAGAAVQSLAGAAAQSLVGNSAAPSSGDVTPPSVYTEVPIYSAPLSGDAELSSSEAELPAGETGPSSGSAESPSGDSEPLSGNIASLSGDSEPRSGKSEPFSGRIEPLSGNGEPLSGRIEPLSGNGEPLSGRTEPFSGNGEPLSGNSKPFSVNARPAQESTYSVQDSQRNVSPAPAAASTPQASVSETLSSLAQEAKRLAPRIQRSASTRQAVALARASAASQTTASASMASPSSQGTDSSDAVTILQRFATTPAASSTTEVRPNSSRAVPQTRSSDTDQATAAEAVTPGAGDSIRQLAAAQPVVGGISTTSSAEAAGADSKASEPASARGGVLVSQIVNQARRTLAVYPERGKATFEVRPPELGRVSIEIVMTPGDTARTVIQAHTLQGREALLANAPQLKAEFSQQGLPQPQLNFSLADSGAQGSPYSAFEQRRAQLAAWEANGGSAARTAPNGAGIRSTAVTASGYVRRSGGRISVTV